MRFVKGYRLRMIHQISGNPVIIIGIGQPFLNLVKGSHIHRRNLNRTGSVNRQFVKMLAHPTLVFGHHQLDRTVADNIFQLFHAVFVLNQVQPVRQHQERHSEFRSLRQSCRQL